MSGTTLSIHIDATEVEELNFLRWPVCTAEGWLTGRTAEEECPILRGDARTEGYLYSADRPLGYDEPYLNTTLEPQAMIPSAAVSVPEGPGLDFTEQVHGFNEAARGVTDKLNGIQQTLQDVAAIPDKVREVAQTARATMEGVQSVANGLSAFGSFLNRISGNAGQQSSGENSQPAVADQKLGEVKIGDPGTLKPVFAANTSGDAIAPAQDASPIPVPVSRPATAVVP